MKTAFTAAGIATTMFVGFAVSCMVVVQPADADPTFNACPQLNNSGPMLHSLGLNAASCEFAEDVRFHFNMYHGGGDPIEIYAHSPVTGQSYLMTCTHGSVQNGNGTRVEAVRCEGGDNAVVDLWGDR
jgi:hypothetical protein